MSQTLDRPSGTNASSSNQSYVPWLCMAVVGSALLWTYGNDLGRLAGRWWGNQDYIHGFLVIPFSLFLAWRRRAMVAGGPLKGNAVVGTALMVVAVMMRCLSAYMTDPLLGPLSIPVCISGIVFLVGGKSLFAWLWPSIAILPFMIPIPDFMASWGNLALQRVATIASTFLLQTLGVPAAAFGNVIVLTNTELGVEEACSGLRSTVLFLAVSVGAAMLLDEVPERVAAILIAIPAAVLSNIIRIVATGLLYQYSSHELAEAVFHDFFGLLMLPLAAGMTLIAIRATAAVFPAAVEDRPLALGSV
ncbi:Transmembrane exosortase [Stieleria neptunia]|uniref:Transmembrane exosortase n=1 Tax=Stieleria neptunia TaxID=2527979 RepID=A0A518HNA9_9BACT|nr:exosortase/archaeosortase family protein [Stieleria neptunia]QDV42310.1 Transmembrane exosortase [Stieleria neptunia]